MFNLICVNFGQKKQYIFCNVKYSNVYLKNKIAIRASTCSWVLIYGFSKTIH